MMPSRLNVYSSRQGYRRRPRRSASDGCLRTLGCLGLLSVISVIVIAIAAPLLPSLILRAAGLIPLGQTSQVFQPGPARDLPMPMNAAPVQIVTITVPSLGSRTVDTTSAAYTISLGNDASGQPAARAEITEAGLYQYCRDSTPLCRSGSAPIIIERFDLRPGGAIIYARASTEQSGWLAGTVGAVVQVDASGRRLELTGVDINGQLYGLPSEIFGYRPAEVEQLINNALIGLQIHAEGTALQLDQIEIGEDALVVSLR